MKRNMLGLLAVAGLALAGVAGALGSGMVNLGTMDPMAAAAHFAAGGKAPGRHGFQVEDGTVTGTWVSFTVDNASGTITQYTAKGPWADALLFSSIRITPNPLASAQARGPLWGERDQAVRVGATDSPAALFGVQNTGDAVATVVFTVADGISVSALPNGSGAQLAKDAHTADLRVRGDATVTIAGQVVTVTMPNASAVAFHIEGYPALGLGHGGPRGFGGRGPGGHEGMGPGGHEGMERPVGHGPGGQRGVPPAPRGDAQQSAGAPADGPAEDSPTAADEAAPPS